MLEQSPAISQETTVQEQVSAPVEQQVTAQPVTQEVTTEVNTPSFLESLSEDLRGAKSLSNFKDVNDLAKSYLHAQQLIGKRLSDISPEDMKVLDSFRGVPEAADKYTLPEELPAEDIAWYKNMAHEVKLTQEQAKKVLDSYTMLKREATEKFKKEYELKTQAGIEELKKEFGSAFDNRIELAKRAVTNFGGQELKDYLNETGLGNDPKLVKIFANIGKALLEDSVVDADKSTAFGVTPQDAQNMINQKMANPEFLSAYYSNLHPGHKQAVAEIEALLGKM